MVSVASVPTVSVSVIHVGHPSVVLPVSYVNVDSVSTPVSYDVISANPPEVVGHVASVTGDIEVVAAVPVTVSCHGVVSVKCIVGAVSGVGPVPVQYAVSVSSVNAVAFGLPIPVKYGVVGISVSVSVRIITARQQHTLTLQHTGEFNPKH